MTAPRADAGAARSSRTPRPDRPATAATTLLVVAALVGGAVGSLTGAVVGAAPAVAGWRLEAAAATQPLSTASLGARFDSRSGSTVTPGSNPASTSGLLAIGAGLADVVNTSSVPARLTVTLTASGVTGLAVQTCSVPWTAAMTCPAGAQDITGAATTRTWTADLDVGATQYVKASVTLGLGATTTLSAAVTPQRTTGLDRTAA